MLKAIYEIYKTENCKRKRVAVVSTAAKAVRYVKEHLSSDDTTMAIAKNAFSFGILPPYSGDVLNTKDITNFHFLCGCCGECYAYSYEVDKVNVE